MTLFKLKKVNLLLKLKKQVDKHNSVIERTFKLEEHSKYVDERITRLESEVEK